MIAGGIEERSLGAKQAELKKHNIPTFFESIPALLQKILLLSCHSFLSKVLRDSLCSDIRIWAPRASYNQKDFLLLGGQAVCYSLHAYLQILHDSIALQSNSLSPTDFDWKRKSGWEEFEPIGSLELLYLMCLQDKLWQQYVYFIHEWVKMYVVLCVFGILTVLMPWPCRIFWMTILKC